MSFEDLLIDAEVDPSRVDFSALRRAWVDEGLIGKVPWDDEAFEEVHMRLATKDWAGALELVDELLEAHPLAVELRLWRAQALTGLGDRREAGVERAIANGLLRAVLRSGTGESLDRAMEALCMREALLVLNLMGLRLLDSRVYQEDGVWFGEMSASGDDDGRRTVFFCLASGV